MAFANLVRLMGGQPLKPFVYLGHVATPAGAARTLFRLRNAAYPAGVCREEK